MFGHVIQRETRIFDMRRRRARSLFSAFHCSLFGQGRGANVDFFGKNPFPHKMLAHPDKVSSATEPKSAFVQILQMPTIKKPHSEKMRITPVFNTNRK
jgi:hypothetical protein